jgi:hypothetical protein
MKSNRMKYGQGVVMILVVVLVLVAMRWFYLHMPRTAIDVEESLLRKVVKPGKYVGEAIYSPTPLYPNGLVTSNVLEITENADEKNIQYTNELVARDRKTDEIHYKAVRKGKYFYKPSHGTNLFNTSESYIDGQIVSTSYGYATAKTDNSIDFTVDSAWHVIDDEYTNAKKDLRREGDVLYGDFTHPTFFGGSALTFMEKYTMIKG